MTGAFAWLPVLCVEPGFWVRSRTSRAARATIHVLLCVVVLIRVSSAQEVNPAVSVQAAPVTGAFRDASFRSAALKRQMNYRIFLPLGYEAGKSRYPVLYLLHGLHGHYNDWSDRTHASEQLKQLQFIVVTPEGNDSWYTNAFTISNDRFEDYIVHDLISEVDSHYRTLKDRNARAIAGLSMGGYGAMKIVLKHPDKFFMAGSFSGALNAPLPEFAAKRFPQYAAVLNEVFGPADSRARRSNDIYRLVKEADPAKVPYIYFDCGTSDPLLPDNREFAAALADRKILYEYREVPGDHGWQYWDRQLPEFLRLLQGRLQSSH